MKQCFTHITYLTFSVLTLQACSVPQSNDRERSSKDFVVRNCAWEGVKRGSKKLDFVVIQREKSYELDLCEAKTCVRISSPRHRRASLQKLCRYSTLYLHQKYPGQELRFYGASKRIKLQRIVEKLKIRNQIDCFKILEQKTGKCLFSDVAKKNGLEIHQLDYNNQVIPLESRLNPPI